jgi:chitinase
MNDSNKAVRKLLYQDLTFLGTADWAVDLQSENEDSSSSGSSGGGTVYIDPGIWNPASLLVTAVPGMTLIWPPMPLPTPTTISFPLWTTTVSYSSLTTLKHPFERCDIDIPLVYLCVNFYDNLDSCR